MQILFAKDKELNRWCSIKKAVQRRPDHVEKYDIIAFEKKGKNESLKKKYLPSLFVEQVGDPSSKETVYSDSPKRKHEQQQNSEPHTEKNTPNDNFGSQKDESVLTCTPNDKVSVLHEDKAVIKKKSKKNRLTSDVQAIDVITNLQKSKLKKNSMIIQDPSSKTALKKKSNNFIVDKTSTIEKCESPTIQKIIGTDGGILKPYKQINNIDDKNTKNQNKKKRKLETLGKDNRNNKKRKIRNEYVTGEKGNISDARLKAYGINPKKFKNKLKYGKKCP